VTALILARSGAGPILLILAGIGLLLFVVLRQGGRPPARPAPLPRPAGTPRRQIRVDVPHLLYVYEWAAGGDCYFGISNEPDARHRRHGVDPDDRWWYEQTTKVMHELAWYPNRAAALAAERAAIRAACSVGAALANTVHNTRARGRRPRARA
jgi:predicted GIY-YIG superfamily endonuclease